MMLMSVNSEGHSIHGMFAWGPWSSSWWIVRCFGSWSCCRHQSFSDFIFGVSFASRICRYLLEYILPSTVSVQWFLCHWLPPVTWHRSVINPTSWLISIMTRFFPSQCSFGDYRRVPCSLLQSTALVFLSSFGYFRRWILWWGHRYCFLLMTLLRRPCLRNTNPVSDQPPCRSSLSFVRFVCVAFLLNIQAVWPESFCDLWDLNLISTVLLNCHFWT